MGVIAKIGFLPAPAIGAREKRLVRFSIGHELVRQLLRDRDRAIRWLSAAALAARRHHQPRRGTALQVADEKARDLRGPRAGLRGHLDIEAEIAIERLGRIDDRTHLVIVEPVNVARREVLADPAEPVGPCVSIDDPRVAAGGEVERGLDRPA